MRVLLVEDEPRAAQMLVQGAARAVVRGRCRRRRRRGAVSGRDHRLRRHRPRRHAARASTGSRCAASCAAPASHVPVLMLTARDAIDCAHRGSRQRRRRLPDQAVRFRRAAGATARGHPARPAAADARGSSVSGDLRLDLRARQAFRRDHADQADLPRVRAARVPGPPRRRSRRARRDRRARVGCAVRVDVQRHRRLIQRLRRKIDDPHGTSLITTRRGEGYMLALDHATPSHES